MRGLRRDALRSVREVRGRVLFLVREEDEGGVEMKDLNEIQKAWKKLDKDKRKEATTLAKWLGIAVVVGVLAVLSLLFL